MASIQQNRAGNWEARVRRKGHHETATFDTEGEALRWSNSTEARLKAGERIDPRRLREGPALDAAIQSQLRTAAGRLSAKTVKDYGSYAGYLPATWHSRRLGTFAASEIIRFHGELTAKRGRSIANHICRWLRAVFNYTTHAGEFTGPNPVARLKFHREHSRERFLLIEEADRFMEALAGEPSLWRDYFLLLLLTGLRRSALAGLRWGQVNLQTGMVNLIAGEAGTKGKGGAMALSSRALEILRARRAADTSGEFVFPSPSPRGGAHIVAAKPAWDRIRKRSGLHDLHIHDLRRTLGSWLTAAGAPTALTMKALGHSTLAAAQVYQRLDLEPVRAALNQVARAVPALPPTAMRELPRGKAVPVLADPEKAA